MSQNIADLLFEQAASQPQAAAVIHYPRRGRAARITFAELNNSVDACVVRLAQLGILPGMRTILMVRPGPDFFALTFALMRLGAIPVLIDPGMGKRNMVRCLASVEASAFIGIPLAHVLRKLSPRSFRTVRICVTVGRRWFWGGHALKRVAQEHRQAAPLSSQSAVRNPQSQPATAAILFTTGSTGPPKGVVYQHATFAAQVRALRDHFGLRPGQIDLATFPLFALFDAALGVAAVIPRMNPTRPGFVNPHLILNSIRDNACTNMFASPALLDRVGRYGAARRIKLPTLHRIITAGAPVRPDILERFAALLNHRAEITTGYGATEALPVAAMSHGEILADTQHLTARGAGTCVGRPVGDVQVRIIRITDEPIREYSDDLLVPALSEGPGGGAGLISDLHHLLQAHVGEILVSGSVVTQEYFKNPAANSLAKIDDSGRIWHRMGDLGYIDSQGRLWMCGRKSHRVVTDQGTLFTDCVEALFNQHPLIRRTALVGLGERPRQTPVLCIELAGRRLPISRSSRLKLIETLRLIGAANAATSPIQTFLFHRRFPVDIRHNAKIFREKLTEWAAKKCRRR